MQLLLKLSLLIRWHIPSSTQQLQVSESYRNTQHLDWSNNSNFYYQNDQNQPLYLIDWSCPTKDKVNASLDVTLVKVVCSKQIHEGVLCPQEPDIVEHGFVTVYTQCHCLHSRHSRPCIHCFHWFLWLSAFLRLPNRAPSSIWLPQVLKVVLYRWWFCIDNIMGLWSGTLYSC